MVTLTETNTLETPLPLIDQEIEARVRQERERLLGEAEISVGRPAQFKRPAERPFSKQDRVGTTVLFGGLTMRHERLLQAALEGLGYKVGIVPTPVKADFQAGKEFGNNGQCNPTYFTVGSVVNYLRELRDKQGMSTQQILDDYIFITAGACGPCRFGMYEAEYRLALRNSGFDGFRVMLFQQGGGLDQSDVEAGFEFNFDFMLSLLNSVFLGDLVNEVAYHIRPYEVEPGKTDAVFERAVEALREKLQNKSYADMQAGTLAKFLSKVTPVSGDAMAEKFLDQLRGDYYTAECRKIARMLDEEVEVDYTRAKPTVKITGEFWAQTTEGDGNFNMFPFLEREGAEVLVEPVTTWIAYMLQQAISKTTDSRGLEEDEPAPAAWNVPRLVTREIKYQKKMFAFRVGMKIIEREYERIREALGGTAHKLACQKHLERLGHPYYNSRSAGGEGHLEVAKNIYYSMNKLAHMVISLKPFGCMPSTQSDGAQAAVISHYSDIIFLPIETSGEGDVNAHSRVQMALGEAKGKSREEFKGELERSGYSLERIREYVADHRELRKPITAMKLVPHYDDIIGRAAKFVRYVGERMKAEGVAQAEALACVA